MITWYPIWIWYLAYLLTPWCRVLREKLTGLQLVKKFPAFHGTRRLITALTSVRHLSLSWARPIQSIYPHPTSWRSILMLSTHLWHLAKVGKTRNTDRIFTGKWRKRTFVVEVEKIERTEINCPESINSIEIAYFWDHRLFVAMIDMRIIS